MKNMDRFVVISVLVVFVYCGRPLVHTEYGDVLGTQWFSFKGRKFNVFMSIPYAEKPIGDLRFEEPKEPKSWSVPIDGSVRSPSCPQMTYTKPYITSGSEDCLYLNVFTPIENFQNITHLLPVVIFIPGGAFYFFSGLTFGPRYLLDKDIILVTFNYRLGIFGFLCTEDEVAPGNNGMKDQVMALGWVQRNIEFFGGDSHSVTLMGMSAGAVSVHYHYFSILSRGLFHRGFMLGGSTFSHWAVQKKPRQKAESVAKWLGCSTLSSRAMVSCLREKDAEKLTLSVTLFQAEEYGPLIVWGPVIDKWSENPFMAEFPILSILRKKHYNVPLLISDTPNAGLFPTNLFMTDSLLAELDLDWRNLGSHTLDIVDTVDGEKMDDVMKTIKTTYFGRTPIYHNISSLIKLVSDRMYLADAAKGAMFHAAINPNIYFYMFYHRGHKSSGDSVPWTRNRFGASHIDDVYYLMNMSEHEPLEKWPEDVKMVERLTEMLYKYTKTGRPVFLPSVYWPAQEGPSTTFRYLRIDSPDSAVIDGVENFGNVIFWDRLPIHEPWAGRFL